MTFFKTYFSRCSKISKIICVYLLLERINTLHLNKLECKWQSKSIQTYRQTHIYAITIAHLQINLFAHGSASNLHYINIWVLRTLQMWWHSALSQSVYFSLGSVRSAIDKCVYYMECYIMDLLCTVLTTSSCIKWLHMTEVQYSFKNWFGVLWNKDTYIQVQQ
jgi:hypothetical protein